MDKKEQTAPKQTDWAWRLDPRMQSHVSFARTYTREFNHGAPMQLDLLTISALAGIIERYYAAFGDVPEPKE
jgi:hypothetical protein